MQETCAAKSFSRRPNQNECVIRPRLFATRLPKSAMKFEQLLSILPNRDCRAELAELLEVLSKQRLETRTQFICVQLHQTNMEGRPLCRPHFLRTRVAAATVPPIRSIPGSP